MMLDLTLLTTFREIACAARSARRRGARLHAARGLSTSAAWSRRSARACSARCARLHADRRPARCRPACLRAARHAPCRGAVREAAGVPRAGTRRSLPVGRGRTAPGATRELRARRRTRTDVLQVLEEDRRIDALLAGRDRPRRRSAVGALPSPPRAGVDYLTIADDSCGSRSPPTTRWRRGRAIALDGSATSPSSSRGHRTSRLQRSAARVPHRGFDPNVARVRRLPSAAGDGRGRHRRRADPTIALVARAATSSSCRCARAPVRHDRRRASAPASETCSSSTWSSRCATPLARSRARPRSPSWPNDSQPRDRSSAGSGPAAGRRRSRRARPAR